MARRRAPETPEVDMGDALRRDLLRKYDQLDRRHVAAPASGPVFARRPWRRLVERLQAGDPVVLARWQLPRWAIDGNPHGFVRLEADNSLTPLPLDAVRQL